MYPVWGLPKYLPGVSQGGRACLRVGLLGAHRFRSHPPAPARATHCLKPPFCKHPLRGLFEYLSGQDRHSGNSDRASTSFCTRSRVGACPVDGKGIVQARRDNHGAPASILGRRKGRQVPPTRHEGSKSAGSSAAWSHARTLKKAFSIGYN